MNILITGGCGYVGTVLTTKLISKGAKVTVLDTQWFGNNLKKMNKLNIIKDDIRNIKNIKLKNIDSVIHLANIANDPSVELNPTLSWEVNVLSTKLLLDKCIENNVKNFIYASSGSVYGIKKENKVTEDLPLIPISIYNKTKMISERIILSYKNDLDVKIIRPATVSGYSPRMRLDISVNALTVQALTKKKITVFGGKQIRPNIHIDDLVNVYLFFLNKKIKKSQFIYNAGFENISILNIAKKIQKYIPSEIIIKKNTDDIRSYRQDSSRLLNEGFKKKYTIDNSIKDIIDNYTNKKFKDEDICYTTRWMKKKKII